MACWVTTEVAALREQAGAMDVLINNAGIGDQQARQNTRSRSEGLPGLAVTSA